MDLLLPMRARFSLIVFFAGIFLAGCATFQVGFERVPTPDLEAVGTLAHLMLQGTQYAAEATRLAIPITPTAVTGWVSGQLCYPSERIPPMKLYFRDENDVITELDTVANQARYTLELHPGEYISFAWVPEYQLGGLYSQAVLCAANENCTDHSPVQFEVIAGQSLTGIDLCDWAFSANALPIPSGFRLP